MLHSLFLKKLHVTHVTCDVCDIKRDVCDIANYLKIKNKSFLQTLENRDTQILKNKHFVHVKMHVSFWQHIDAQNHTFTPYRQTSAQSGVD